MQSYTTSEKVNFVSWYFQGLSSREISDNFAVFYPNRPIPSKSTVSRIVDQFKSTGCVNSEHTKRVRTHTVSNDENKEIICASIEANPSNSVRGMANELGINRETCRRVLKSEGYKCFKLKNVQKLHDGDSFRRMEFCETWIDKINRNPRLKNKILFTDECTFYLEGFVNKQNDRFWAKENPNQVHERHHQVRHKVNVWCGIAGSRIIGPYFFGHNINGNNYLEFLQRTVVPAIDALELPHPLIFMHDGCPAHGSAEVTEFLNNTFGNNWIGLRGPYKWPARSPDLNPLDFFYWGYMKEKVFKVRNLRNIEEMRQTILQVSQDIPNVMLQNVSRAFYDRLGFCLAQYGNTFEQLL